MPAWLHIVIDLLGLAAAGSSFPYVGRVVRSRAHWGQKLWVTRWVLLLLIIGVVLGFDLVSVAVHL